MTNLSNKSENGNSLTRTKEVQTDSIDFEPPSVKKELSQEFRENEHFIQMLLNLEKLIIAKKDDNEVSMHPSTPTTSFEGGITYLSPFLNNF